MSNQRLVHGLAFALSAWWLTATVSANEPLVAPAKSVRPAKSPIALIDLKYIFNHYEGFQKRKEKLDTSVELAEAAVALRKASYDKLKKDLDKALPGTPEHTSLERTLAQEAADFKAFLDVQRKTFIRQEAKLYHETYLEISRIIQAYIAQKEILVVLRFNSNLMGNPADAKAVAEHLNKPIVAYKAHIDITHEVLRRLREAGRVRVTGRPGK